MATTADPTTALDVAPLVGALARRERVPAAGSVAALVAALAAGILAKAALYADDGGALAQADALSTRLSLLAEEDARVYAAALDALNGADGDAQERRDFALGRALAGAADVPAAIADACADVAWLAGVLVETGDPELAADAAAAAALAAGASRAAAHLVVVNLGVRVDAETARGARAAAAAATETAARTLDR